MQLNPTMLAGLLFFSVTNVAPALASIGAANKSGSHLSHELGLKIHIKPRARSGIQMLRVSSGSAGWIVLWDKPRARPGV